MSEMKISCMNCAVTACQKADKEKYPPFCPTKNMDEKLHNAVLEKYNDEENRKIACVSASVEGDYYCQLTRAEEILVFAKRMGYKKIGIANCVGLINEARIFAKMAEKNGFDVVMVSCKIDAVEKSVIGVEDAQKLNKGCGHESMCNPVMQAEFLNSHNTELNVIVGLCVGHDSLFIKHSNAIITNLVTKDRVLAHNPAAALYNSTSYYKRLLEGNVPD
ncbi:MAG: DUF1847 domain-containing protein [Firmicutes bacterium]|nr:DUF1847 domain-containing protein [Bacillota bacterium]